jgi:hypothetical protein
MFLLKQLNSFVYEVGYYGPEGRWEVYCSLDSRSMAERTVNYLNGGNGFPFDLKPCFKNPDVGPWPGGPLSGTP